MDVSNVTSAGVGAAARGAGRAPGRDDFLRLFVTQLRHQDPLSPLDSTGFTAQLAQFSSLEQLTGINDRLDGLVLHQNSLGNMLAANLIGREIVFDAPGGGAEGGAGEPGRGIVTGVLFEKGSVRLVVDGTNRVSPGDVREIR